MKPLAKTELTALKTRFCDYESIEIKSVAFQSANALTLTFNTQDKQRDYDWIAISLAFTGVSDARLDGIEKANNLSFFYEEMFILCDDISSTKRSALDARCYIVAENAKIEELNFIP